MQACKPSRIRQRHMRRLRQSVPRSGCDAAADSFYATALAGS